ncbi:glycosyltransferase [Halocola ammonii]
MIKFVAESDKTKPLQPALNSLKVAIIHDWFVVKGGAEQVFRQIHSCFPNADIYALFNNLTPDLQQQLVNGKEIKVTYLQKLPFVRKHHRYFFPLFKSAIESLDLSEYDLIISSSHAVAKGVKINKNQKHLCYCHTPVRYAWDLRKEYLEHVQHKGIRQLANWQLDKLRNWDLDSASRVTSFAANSEYVSDRIRKNYQREAKVVYPPIDTEFFTPNGTAVEERSQYLVVSRMVPYKRIDIVIRAFEKLPHLKLKIIGDGPDFHSLKSIASPNVEFMGYIDDESLKREMRVSKALIMAANEDFGITSLEAQACGIPVIALKKGGYLETVVEGETGIFFEEQSSESVLEAIERFEKMRFDFSPLKARGNAMRFSNERFLEDFIHFVNSSIQDNDPTTDK